MRKLLLPLAVVLVASVGFTGPAAAADSAVRAPLNVKVAPFAGKKVKVGKKLKMIVSCSKNCIVKVKFKLITPGLSDSVKGGKALPANTPWITGMLLSNFGRNLLRNSYRQSRFKVILSAKDTSNGKMVRKTRTFKFTK